MCPVAEQKPGVDKSRMCVREVLRDFLKVITASASRTHCHSTLGEDAEINDRMDVNEWLRKQLEVVEPDLLREMVQTLAGKLMSVDADDACPPTAPCLPIGLAGAMGIGLAIGTPGSVRLI